jgi:DNA-binding NarL/FixJ family response regulator
MATAFRPSCRLSLPERKHPSPTTQPKILPSPQTSAKNLRVLMTGGNRLLNEALTRTLRKHADLQLLWADLSSPDATKQLAEIQAEVCVLSSRGNLEDNLAAIYQVRTSAPNVRILLISAPSDQREFLQCVRAGVSGYLPADASGLELVQAIRAVAAGEAVCRAAQCEALFRNFERDAACLPTAAVQRKLGLTRREQQLIPFIAEGLTNKEIASHFSLSEQTVKNHLYRMKHKMGADDRLTIVQIYREQGFLI